MGLIEDAKVAMHQRDLWLLHNDQQRKESLTRLVDLVPDLVAKLESTELQLQEAKAHAMRDEVALDDTNALLDSAKLELSDLTKRANEVYQLHQCSTGCVVCPRLSPYEHERTA